MKIELFTVNRVSVFTLPPIVTGSFNFDEDIDTDNPIMKIDGEKHKWVLKVADDAKLFKNGVEINESVLQIGEYYVIERDEVNYLVYISPIMNEGVKGFVFNESLKLSVGTNPKNQIICNCPFLQETSIYIQYEKDHFILQVNDKVAVYVNDIYLLDKKVILNYGDVINLYGLKIYFLNKVLFVNNPNNSVTINTEIGLKPFRYKNKEELINEEFNDQDLYNEKDYFLKSPRMRRTISKEEIIIDAPPSLPKEEKTPLLYVIGPMLTMGLTSVITFTTTFIRAFQNKESIWSSWPTLLTSTAMLLSSLLWPNIMKSYNKKKQKKEKTDNTHKYIAYLDLKEKEIETAHNIQRDILNENLISTLECADIINKKDISLWNRRIEHDDFLTVRVGSGDVELSRKIKYPSDSDFMLEYNDLKEKAKKVGKRFEYVKNAPIGYSFLDNYITNINGDRNKEFLFTADIILKLITLHSYTDLKIVMFTEPANEKNWEFLKDIPHIFDDEKQIRFYATNIEDAKYVSSYLEYTLNFRRYGQAEENPNKEYSGNYKNYRPYYIVLTDNYTKYRRLGILKKLTELDQNYGFSIILLENAIGNLPSKCKNYITIGSRESSILIDAFENQTKIDFDDELDYKLDFEELAIKLSNIPIEIEKTAEKNLPTSISFLEMYKVGKVNHLNVLNRWQSNDPSKNLKAVVGVDENDDFIYLDCHEKAHGPHGLIAGMTGSGKSEFIITYVLSLAVNFSPDIVSFVLIDYKGGGLAGAFENKLTGLKLPHLSGVITNLDKSELNRTLVSIDSEIKRRQQKFNEARDKLGESTIDIYKYQRFYLDGKLEEPIPHLLIICDEFAELREQQPEFMSDLISIARIGRSLGVHLILATQKPSGVVNNQIWSNSKFRICLKVQDRGDSNEMIKIPNAAEITNAGRFYMQVGYNEYLALGQSGWAGAKYVPKDKIIKQIDKNIVFINEVGAVIKEIKESVSNKNTNDQGEELINVLKEVVEVAKEKNLKSLPLWLENIPENIYFEDIVKKYNIQFEPFNPEAIIGEFDAPEMQYQSVLKYSIRDDGNTIICGSNASDYEQMISTIIYSSTFNHTPEEINYYIIDYGSEVLRRFYNLPHVGDMVFQNELDKQNKLLKMIENELQRRKKLFIDYGGDYKTYIKRSNEKLPLIVVIVNAYDSFLESNSTISEVFSRFCRDGSRYGIFFMFTCNNANVVGRRIRQNCNRTFTLRMNDKADYYNLITGKIRILPKNVAGRGLFNDASSVYEFQTLSIVDDESLNDYLIDYTNKAKEYYKDVKAEPIPTLPDQVTEELISDYITDINNVPVGIYNTNLALAKYDFAAYASHIISANKIDSLQEFTNNLIQVLSKTIKTALVVIDAYSNLDSELTKNYYNNDFELVITNLTTFIDELNKTEDNYCVCIINGIEKIASKVNAEVLTKFTSAVKASEKIFVVYCEEFKKIKKIELETWFSAIKNTTDGIWIGTGVSEQNIFRISRVTKDMQNTYDNSYGYIIKDNQGELAKVLEFNRSIVEEEENE